MPETIEDPDSEDPESRTRNIRRPLAIVVDV